MLRDIELKTRKTQKTGILKFYDFLVSDNQFNLTLGRLNLTWRKDTYRGFTRCEI